MTGDPLLVPMHVNAMVLGVEQSLATPFRWFQLEYEQLRAFNGIKPGPFAGGERQPAPGIYLHWILPRPLRHGSHDPDSGSTSFPPVPNRWVVVRIQQGASDSAVKAWIVESDYRPSHAGSAPGTSAFVDPRGLDTDGLPTPVSIGRSYQLTPSVTALGTTGTPFLTAVGPGSAHFSLFAPGVQDVFGLYDDVSDEGGTPIDAAAFTFHVAGWYSDAGFDPLSGASWTASDDPTMPGAYVDDKLGLVAWLPATPGPTSMIVHGLTSGVTWSRGDENVQPPSYPVDTKSTVKVAFGNSALDAVAAIVRLNDGSQTEADLLEAFGYGLLDRFDQPGSAAELDLAIRDHWFSSTPGGTRWTVVAPEAPGPTALPTPAPAPLTTPQAEALARLNAAQRELDRQSRVLESMRWRLYALWWKCRWLQQNSPFMAPVDPDYAQWLQTQLSNQVGLSAPSPNPGGWYVDRVAAWQAQVSTQERVVRAAAAALDALLEPTKQVRKAVPMPQYHAPNDPVVVATALGRSTNLDPVGDLTCRLRAQAVSALTVAGRSYCATGTCDQVIAAPPLADPHGLLPPAVQALHTEALFLSPPLFAQNVLGDASRADVVAAALAALPKPAPNAQFVPAAGSYDLWQQPWVPLLLDWEVTALKQPAYAAPESDGPAYALVQGNWTFDGNDYRWTGPTRASGLDFNEEDSGSMTLSGRVFITPQVSFTLAGQLDDWVKKHALRDPALEALLEKLDTAVEAMAGHDILSQRLGGLRSALVQRDETPTVPPSGSILSVLGTTPLRGFPSPFPDQVALPVWAFAPMCGTFFVVTRLSVIDFMGRTVDLTLTNWSQAPQTAHSDTESWFYPIAAPALRAPTTKDPAPDNRQTTDPTPRMLMLPPRFVQDAQLALRLSANDGSDADVDVVAGGDPVCGWLVANHLDRSIMVYAPDGTPWGEAFLSAHVGGGYLPQWQSDPTNPAAPQSVAAIPNQYVRGILAALFARGDDGAGFADLLATIDAALYTIDPGGQGIDQDLAVLVGRPLAVVRAQASLRLHGLPPLNQDWWTTFDVDPANPPDANAPAPLGEVDGGIRDLTWPVRLGDSALRGDGLVGYFLDDPATPGDTYTALNVVQAPPGAQSNYLRQIGQGNYVQLRPVDDSVPAPDPARNELANLTLLLDPRGAVHAFSGLLPVTQLALPITYSASALATIAYLFRAGPLLSTPDAVHAPRPADHAGTWEWFDRVTGASVPIAPPDARVNVASTPAVAREGWLRFTPAPPRGGS